MTDQLVEYRMLRTPIGELLLAGHGDTLHRVGFPAGKGQVQVGVDWVRNDKALERAAHQLGEYFVGSRREFDLDLNPVGTPFQQSVWQALLTIPYGETRSYGEIARQIERPKAVRSVGTANGSNPLPVIVPCHRVIGANGSLVGFGGGLPIKRDLLALEQPQRSLL